MYDLSAYYDLDDGIGWGEKCILVVASVVSCFSLLGSLGICAESFYEYNDSTVARVLFWMHIGHLPFDAINMLGDVPVPSELRSIAWGAAGTQATCTATGMAKHFGAAWTVHWDMVLSLVYLLLLRYNTPDIQLRRFERPVWIVNLLLSAVPTGVAVAYDVYNFQYSGCWFAGVPNDCATRDDLTCHRGRHYLPFIWYGAVFVVMQIVFSVYAMRSIYLQLAKLERQVARYGLSPHDAEAEPSEKLRTVARQGICYVSTSVITFGAFILSTLVGFVWPMIPDLLYLALDTIPVYAHGWLFWAFFLRHRTVFHTSFGRHLAQISRGAWHVVTFVGRCRSSAASPTATSEGEEGPKTNHPAAATC
jgi:hypothetical protein